MVVEDCAHSFGAEYGNKMIGNNMIGICNCLADWSRNVGRIGRFAIHITILKKQSSESVIRPRAGTDYRFVRRFSAR